MITAKTEISKALSTEFANFAQTIEQLDKASFESAPAGKWTPGQQLDHLIRSVKPLNMALGLPKFVPRMLFGKLNRPPRTFEETLEKYNQKLANGGKASLQYIPPTIYFNQKDEKLKSYKSQLHKLTSKLDTLTDEQLDSILLPHPLLGKLTIREMLFFAIFHTQHHQKSVLSFKS